MKPIIGITSSIVDERSLSVSLDYIRAIVQAGGVPTILPNLTDISDAERLLAGIDGLLVTGGTDVNPSYYGEEPHPKLDEVTPERDGFERAAILKFMEQDKPVLAICRGCQMLNVAGGGTLYQDISDQYASPLAVQHSQKGPRSHASHTIDVAETSLLHRITQSLQYKVNSFHHQAVKTVAAGFEVSARAADGIVEAIESNRHRFVLGVQWHPENLAKVDDPYTLKLFTAFVAACGR